MKKIIEFVGISWALYAAIQLTICLFISYLGDTKVWLYFNSFHGEGVIEMIFFPLFVLAGFYALMKSFMRLCE